MTKEIIDEIIAEADILPIKDIDMANITAETVSELIAVMTAWERTYYTENVNLLTADGKNAAYCLLPLLAADSWQVRAKALITIGRIGSADLGDEIIGRLQAVDEPWWQLQYLDCWWQLPLEVCQREKTLANLIEWAYQPVTIRGLVWLLSELATPQAAWLFARLAVDKKSMVVRDEMMADCWFKLADSLSASAVNSIIAEVPKFKIWLNFHYREEQPSHYGLYPSPDYLWQCASDFGVERKAFKNLYYKPRKKDKSKVK